MRFSLVHGTILEQDLYAKCLPDLVPDDKKITIQFIYHFLNKLDQTINT